MLRHVVLARIDVSEDLSVSFIRVTTIGDLGTTLAVTNNQRPLRRKNSNLTTGYWTNKLSVRCKDENNVWPSGNRTHVLRPYSPEVIGVKSEAI
jgi:hypothetical protein